MHDQLISKHIILKKNLILIALLAALTQCKTPAPTGIDLDSNPSTLEVFAEGIVSTHLYERDLAISPDGNEVIFTVGDYKQSRRCLVRLVRRDGKWGEKEILKFSGKYQDIEPAFSVDGNRLFFASNRPVDNDSTRTDYNIWVADKTGDAWSDPQPLSAVINSAQDEFYPSVAGNGNLYFTATRESGIGSEDIFVSRWVDGAYAEPEPLDSAINTRTYEFNAYVSPDEDLIIFSSFGRKDDLGGGDLYMSKKDESGQWQPAVNMGPKINSKHLDFCPVIDWPRKNFYFTSQRFEPSTVEMRTFNELDQYANGVVNGMGNIYRVGISEIGVESD